jgi:hypothetical protein
MNKYDKGFEELLNLLRERPDLVREIVFDTANLRKLLGTETARQLTLGEDPTKFLTYMAGSADGSPNAQCLEQTKYFCGKGTGAHLYACGGGTGRK